MTGGDILFLVFIIVAALGGGLYFLNRWASKRMVEQQDTVERSKQLVNIFIIEKKKDKPSNSNLPKEVKSKLPRIYRLMKIPLVKAKVGPQIITLICEPKVFEALPVKKNVRVELAGLYIANMPGMKTKAELKALHKSKTGESKKWYEKFMPSKLFK